MIEFMTVCTGNICRSPLAAQLLGARLKDLGVRTNSAGTRGLADAAMTEETRRLATARGVADADAVGHRARWLTATMLVDADVVFAMTREHRREIVELAPARLRSTFTIREFARLANSLPDDRLREAARLAGENPASRVRAVVAVIAGARGLVPAPADLAQDDVVDPYGRSWRTYELMASQLDPAIDAVERVVRLAAS